MLLASIATRISLALLGLVLSLSCSAKKEPADKEPGPVLTPISDAQPAIASVTTSADAGAPPRDWLCSVVDKVPSGGRFGVASIKKRHPKHAGIRKVLLRSNAKEELHLALLVEDDAENDRGLSINELSPGRGVQAYRFVNESWEDLGRPFQLIGWNVTLEGAVSGGPPAYAASTGIGDVRRALVASCEGGTWTKQARYSGKSFESAALLALENPDAIDNAAIVRGFYADIGKDCKPVTRGGGGKVPVWLEAPPSLAGDSKSASIAFAEPGECRLPRKFLADQRDGSLVVGYEQCGAIDGGDYLQITNCQLSVLWFRAGAWKRLPPFEKLSGEVSDPRAALALGADGPLIAVNGPDGLVLHQASDAGWTPLPALPGGKACLLPLAVRSDPARLVVRSCSGFGRVSAFRLDEGAWKPVGGKFNLKPRWGAQQRPSTAADWVGEVPYLALGYYGAPVAQVFKGVGASWKQILETVVDPTRPKADSK